MTQDCSILGLEKNTRFYQWMMLQQEQAEDFVIATGVQYSVCQFIEWTAEELGMWLRWEGEGVNEVGYWNDQAIVKIDPRYFCPTEVDTLLGDPSKAKQLKQHGYTVAVSVE